MLRGTQRRKFDKHIYKKNSTLLEDCSKMFRHIFRPLLRSTAEVSAN
jgi:hypothetical protein